MISLLKGAIAGKNKNILTLMTAGGVGYDVAVAPEFALGAVTGSDITLFTYLKVSDSALDLYGFHSADERAFFLLLLSVSGVGPKTAMTIMSSGSVDQLTSAIASGDVKYLTAVLGIGKKTAERLVVELKGKMRVQSSEFGVQSSSGVFGEVIDALEAMGYSRDEAKDAIDGLEAEGKTTEELLRMALKRVR